MAEPTTVDAGSTGALANTVGFLVRAFRPCRVPTIRSVRRYRRGAETNLVLATMGSDGRGGTSKLKVSSQSRSAIDGFPILFRDESRRRKYRE